MSANRNTVARNILGDVASRLRRTNIYIGQNERQLTNLGEEVDNELDQVFQGINGVLNALDTLNALLRDKAINT